MPAAIRVDEEQVRPGVLIVEDDILVRLAVSEFLRDVGFRVFEAFDAKEALAVIAAREVDLVFTDVKLPGWTDGFALAQWVRTHKPGVPVVVTSGGAAANFAQQHDLAPNFLRKPFAYDDLLAIFQKLIPDCELRLQGEK